jgi:hypothetical protein
MGKDIRRLKCHAMLWAARLVLDVIGRQVVQLFHHTNVGGGETVGYRYNTYDIHTIEY